MAGEKGPIVIPIETVLSDLQIQNALSHTEYRPVMRSVGLASTLSLPKDCYEGPGEQNDDHAMQYSIESQVEGFKALPPYKRTLKVLLCPQVNHTKNLSLGLTILEPGSVSSPHSHGTEDEIWYVLSGTGEARVGEETIQIAEGTAIYCPPGQSHQLTNNGKEDLRVLWAFSPPGFETKYLGKKGGEA